MTLPGCSPEIASNIAAVNAEFDSRLSDVMSGLFFNQEKQASASITVSNNNIGTSATGSITIGPYYNNKNLAHSSPYSTGTPQVGYRLKGDTSGAEGTFVELGTGSVILTPTSGTFVLSEMLIGDEILYLNAVAGTFNVGDLITLVPAMPSPQGRVRSWDSITGKLVVWPFTGAFIFGEGQFQAFQAIRDSNTGATATVNTRTLAPMYILDAPDPYISLPSFYVKINGHTCNVTPPPNGTDVLTAYELANVLSADGYIQSILSAVQAGMVVNLIGHTGDLANSYIIFSDVAFLYPGPVPPARMTITQFSGGTSEAININKIKFSQGKDWSVGATATATAVNIKNAINNSQYAATYGATSSNEVVTVTFNSGGAGNNNVYNSATTFLSVADSSDFFLNESVEGQTSFSKGIVRSVGTGLLGVDPTTGVFETNEVVKGGKGSQTIIAIIKHIETTNFAGGVDKNLKDKMIIAKQTMQTAIEKLNKDVFSKAHDPGLQDINLFLQESNKMTLTNINNRSGRERELFNLDNRLNLMNGKIFGKQEDKSVGPLKKLQDLVGFVDAKDLVDRDNLPIVIFTKETEVTYHEVTTCGIQEVTSIKTVVVSVNLKPEDIFSYDKTWCFWKYLINFSPTNTRFLRNTGLTIREINNLSYETDTCLIIKVRYSSSEGDSIQSLYALSAGKKKAGTLTDEVLEETVDREVTPTFMGVGDVSTLMSSYSSVNPETMGTFIAAAMGLNYTDLVDTGIDQDALTTCLDLVPESIRSSVEALIKAMNELTSKLAGIVDSCMKTMQEAQAEVQAVVDSANEYLKQGVAILACVLGVGSFSTGSASAQALLAGLIFGVQTARRVVDQYINMLVQSISSIAGLACLMLNATLAFLGANVNPKCIPPIPLPPCIQEWAQQLFDLIQLIQSLVQGVMGLVENVLMLLASLAAGLTINLPVLTGTCDAVALGPMFGTMRSTIAALETT